MLPAPDRRPASSRARLWPGGPLQAPRCEALREPQGERSQRARRREESLRALRREEQPHAELLPPYQRRWHWTH